MSLAPPAPDGSIEQSRDAAHPDPRPARPPGTLPHPLAVLERAARSELARLQAQQAHEPQADEVLMALAWDLGLAGEELPPQ